MRLLFEVRRSRASSVYLLTSGLLYSGVIAFEFTGIVPAGDHRKMLEHGLLLCAHFVLLFSILVYARYVYLDAQGMLVNTTKKPREPKKKKPEGESEKDAPKKSRRAGGTQIRVDAPHTPTTAPTKADKDGPARPAATAAAAKPSVPAKPSNAVVTNTTGGIKATIQTSQVQSQDEDEDDEDDGRQLSKAERKRLKKLRR